MASIRKIIEIDAGKKGEGTRNVPRTEATVEKGGTTTMADAGNVDADPSRRVRAAAVRIAAAGITAVAGVVVAAFKVAAQAVAARDQVAAEESVPAQWIIAAIGLDLTIFTTESLMIGARKILTVSFHCVGTRR